MNTYYEEHVPRLLLLYVFTFLAELLWKRVVYKETVVQWCSVKKVFLEIS